MYVEKSQRKISIIGTGAVGSAIAYAIMMRGLADKIVFIDTNKKLANAELLDIKHGLHNIPCAELVNGDYSDIKDSSIIIVTAGRSRREGESRLDLAQDNIKIAAEITENIKTYYNTGVVIVVSNPVDVITYYMTKHLNLAKGKVFGTGCMLDSSRLSAILTDYLGRNVEIPVIRRPQTAVKVQPSEPGGMEILNQDKSVYDIIEKKDNEPVVENLLPPPEQPKLPEVIPSQQVVQAAPLQVNDQIPEKVIGSAPVAQVKEAAPLPVSANAQTGDAPEAKVIGLKEAVQQENAKAAQAAQIPTQPKVQPAVQPEPKKPAKATAGMWQIQLMSSPNRQAVEKAWISLSKKYKMLQGQPHEIEAADLDFDKTFYRLKAGAFTDRAGADELCKDIKALGGTCIVKKK